MKIQRLLAKQSRRKILKCKFCVLICLFFIQCSSNKKNTKDKNEDPCVIINTLMKNQNTSWNNGDIDAYMEFYWKSDSLQFIGSKGLTYGWDTTLYNYKKSYSTREEMGVLKFENLNCKYLNNSSYLINGKWHLKRNEKLKDLEGFYTLIWKPINGQWKIIYDHSS